ncbi:MAG: LCP family protein, partial [Candidatus Dormibacteraeota bacterium]|nr:LCP family protein [Candidatus Dormibacteraeota bacterium]
DCSFMTVHFDTGMQHMNGTTALIFSRSRHGDNGEGTDFARSRRQQLIIQALKQKVVSIGGIGNLPDLLNALGDNMATDLQIGDVEALYGLVKDVNPASIEHVSIDDTNFLYECGYPQNCGAYYIYAHDQSFQTVSHYIENIFPSEAALAEKAQVTFVDASGRGLDASGRWAKVMGMLTLNCSDGGTAQQQVATQVIDDSGGKDASTAKWLASYFGVSVTTEKPSHSGTTGQQTGTGGITVVLGSNEENAFLGNPGVGT